MPTTTNLGITYPSSSGFVTNGATDMGTIATTIDAFYGAWTSYTPTLTNTTGGVVTGHYRKIGRLLYVRGHISAGTATIGGGLTASLPSTYTTIDRQQPVPCSYNTAAVSAYASASATVINIRKDAAGTAWTGGNSYVGLNWLAVLEIV